MHLLQRGYGGTDAPRHCSEYTITNLSSDMLALVRHLGHERACLVGHDHGANTGWDLAMLHPEVFTCYMAMSVPRRLVNKRGRAPHANIRRVFGDESKPETDPKYFYQLHHCLPTAQDDCKYDSSLTPLHRRCRHHLRPEVAFYPHCTLRAMSRRAICMRQCMHCAWVLLLPRCPQTRAARERR